MVLFMEIRILNGCLLTPIIIVRDGCIALLGIKKNNVNTWYICKAFRYKKRKEKLIKRLNVSGS